jgi:ArsR family transcriptional regulator
MGDVVVSKAKTGRTVVQDDECCPAVLSSPLSDDRAMVLARDFAVLADPVRLRLLSMLASAPAGEVCVCELVEPLRRSQPTISHHLKILGDAGLIVGEKRGRWVWYRVVPGRLGDLRGVLA